MLVIVKSSKNRPLTKITIVDAFRLIKQGRARVVKRSPITIKLIYKKTEQTYLNGCTGYHSNSAVEWIVYHKLLIQYRLHNIIQRVEHWLTERLHMSHNAWRDVRIGVLQRDGFKCQWCGYICPVKELRRKSDKLQVHHIRYKSEGGSNHPSNLITLCRKCHGAVHNGRIELPQHPAPEFVEFLKKLIM